MDDGLVWLPEILDRSIGKKVYVFMEKLLKPAGRNPFSNIMLFVCRKTA